ncbi:MAG: N-acetylglucosaminyl-diphospho-decaprenol L-rhamnosyltransferase [Chlamydiae bacterium]|nr:N-acetylglucosaminyl-diphospho-decaprenol L-rhamnosyltransferase [Chlamydiota bacterium]
MIKVGLIVLNWNGLADTEKCLESLQHLEGVEIVVVDNGSTDGSQEALRGKCTLIETGQNLGFAGGNNVGIEYGLKQGFDFFLILNNDTVVDPNIVQAFLEGFEAHPKAGILGAKIYLMAEPNRFDHFGGMWNKKTLAFDYVGYRELDKGDWEESQRLDYVCGAALMVRREVFEKVGLFDPRFFLFWEEADLCFRARRAGFEVMSCPKAKIWHKVSASFTGKAHGAYFYWRNHLLWIERNFKGSKRVYYLARLLGGKLFFFYAQKSVRTLQLIMQRVTGRDTTRNRERIVRTNAAVCGMHDYLFRRFKAGRSKNFMNCH